MRQVRVMTIFGTRPEAIKMAPLVAELQRRPGLEPVCCVTAQHREMLDSVLEIFRLRPDYDLNIMEPRQTLSTITSKCLLGMEGVLEQARPDLCWSTGTPPQPSPGRWPPFTTRSGWAMWRRDSARVTSILPFRRR